MLNGSNLRRHIGIGFGSIFFSFAACSPEAGGEAVQPTELSQATLDSLLQEVPRLQADPLPQPTPASTATPSQIPDRVEEALPSEVLEQVTGEASFYADHFEGRRTASGIPFRQNQMVAAHRAYPFGTLLRVTNLRNERSVNVKVVDRGPFGSAAKARNTILDLSRRAAEQLGYIDAGRTPVRVEVLQWGSGIAA
jgi:rare lipoprotein A